MQFVTFLVFITTCMSVLLASVHGSDQAHPSLNVTKSIPYQDIIIQYIKDKDTPGHTCPKIWPRAEWRALTPVQQQSWINATRCLGSRPSLLAGTQTGLPGKHTSLLDDFTLLHVRLFYQTHYQSAFLPWHRAFVHARDLAMRRECGFEGPFPYWNWSLDADEGEVQVSPVFSDDHGISGNGTGPHGTVTSGPFAYLPLSYSNNDERNESKVDVDPHYLKRAFGVAEREYPQFPTFHLADTSAAVHRVLTTSGDNFTAFATALEGIRKNFSVTNPGLHGGVHRAIGGDMMKASSSNDPAHFLHHANLDRLWWQWQNGRPTSDSRAEGLVDKSDLNSRFWAYNGPTVEYDIDPSGGPPASLFDVQSLQGLYMPNIEVYKLIDIERPPLCYTYI